ncbi:F0F1 ATP synthase subunit epsilon [Paracoccus seriniphilus]|uniref:ATP synthase epsilon chain n=1 Tax=Paracoccus seriniphilus TaxID=184748 RepID=A0A239PQH9_9RHOB|nr:F0F1 ATP synthase subunit epsilon [Paracoccus seriniphilus]SNT72544.1 F-type H+-transporting ATPase subunit epsilon [Paracoccus seriniphilus]
MQLKIVTPLSVVVETDITSLRAEDVSGSFGILPGHAPFLTTLAVSIASWRRGRREHFCALRGGVLVVGEDGGITIATREAVPGDDLDHLDRDVLERFQSEEDAERVERSETVQLQLNAIRRMVSRLHLNADRGAFR